MSPATSVTYCTGSSPFPTGPRPGAPAAVLLGTDRVLAHPWGDRLDPAYRVALDVQQFDGALGGAVVLKATWIVTGREGKTPLSVRKSDIQEPVSGKDYDALVVAHSRAVAALSREIAGEIRRVASVRPSSVESRKREGDLKQLNRALGQPGDKL